MTALEWLIDQLQDFQCLPSVDIIEKAKQMEKDQIINDFKNGYYHGKGIEPNLAEEYYNENYNKTKEYLEKKKSKFALDWALKTYNKLK
jgi:hypothetical protein